jgi:hypothetical protein
MPDLQNETKIRTGPQKAAPSDSPFFTMCIKFSQRFLGWNNIFFQLFPSNMPLLLDFPRPPRKIWNL